MHFWVIFLSTFYTKFIWCFKNVCTIVRTTRFFSYTFFLSSCRRIRTCRWWLEAWNKLCSCHNYTLKLLSYQIISIAFTILKNWLFILLRRWLNYRFLLRPLTPPHIFTYVGYFNPTSIPRSFQNKAWSFREGLKKKKKSNHDLFSRMEGSARVNYHFLFFWFLMP